MHEASKNEDSGSAASADSKSTSDEFAAAARRRELKGPRWVLFFASGWDSRSRFMSGRMTPMLFDVWGGL